MKIATGLSGGRTSGYNWHHDFSIHSAKRDGVDLEFAFGDSDAGCMAGECMA